AGDEVFAWDASTLQPLSVAGSANPPRPPVMTVEDHWVVVLPSSGRRKRLVKLPSEYEPPSGAWNARNQTLTTVYTSVGLTLHLLLTVSRHLAVRPIIYTSARLGVKKEHDPSCRRRRTPTVRRAGEGEGRGRPPQRTEAKDGQQCLPVDFPIHATHTAPVRAGHREREEGRHCSGIIAGQTQRVGTQIRRPFIMYFECANGDWSECPFLKKSTREVKIENRHSHHLPQSRGRPRPSELESGELQAYHCRPGLNKTQEVKGPACESRS
ncbi:hypothetical protein EDB86DRAFT_2838011, partial [Lactarius hatsudake]